MGPPKEQASLLNVLPQEEFFVRHTEVQQLFHAGLDVSRSLQTSCFIRGKHKSGKTEILRRVYNKLFFEQDRVIPFFLAVPKMLLSGEDFCRDYFLRSVSQYIAFLRRDPRLVLTDEFDLRLIVQLAYETKLAWVVDAVNHFSLFLKNHDRRALSRLAVQFPATAAMKSSLGAFVLVDDFHHMKSVANPEERAGLIHDFLLALDSRHAPLCLAGPAKPLSQVLFGTSELPANLDVMTLSSLTAEEALTLFEGLCGRYEVEFSAAVSPFIVEQLDRNPFYIRSMVHAARRASIGFRSVRIFAELYSRELTVGSMQLYFNSLIHSTNLKSVERIKALEVLHLCAGSSLEFAAFRYLSGQGEEESIDFEKVLAALEELGLVDYGLGIVNSIQDTVLRDWVIWNYSHKVSGIPMNRIAFELTSTLLKKYEQNQQVRPQLELIARMRRLLEGMRCQKIPQTLLNYSHFARMDGKETSKSLVSENASSDILLPEMVSVTLRSPAAQSSNMILIGRGFELGVYSVDTEVAWLVSCVSGQFVGLDEIQRFVAACEALKREESFGQAKMWLVTEGKFNQAALSIAVARGVMTSGPQQLRRLEHLLQEESEDILELEEPEEVTTYEIAIPAAPDSELVAVRALEQIAESIDFDEKAKGQIRMALMEACINMKETMGADGGRIHVQLQTGPGKLTIHMRMAPRMASADPMRDWGLKLLQTLMDDVRLNHTPQGFELSMAKYLRRGKAEAV